MTETARGWHASLGAIVHQTGATTCRVWAPASHEVTLVVEGRGHVDDRRRLARTEGGVFEGSFTDLGTGTRYRYVLDGDGPFPDPASRCQPEGVHGPSMVVDPGAFAWTDQHWAGVPLSGLVVYELHVGTFTDSGTFAGVRERLQDLCALGVTAIELMPVAQFPGVRNWGYDGAALFAPAFSYGTPDDLRRLVDAAHAVGLAVLLDVVYNHTGPDGSYLSRFSPYWFTDRHASPWGAGINLDGAHSRQVRDFFIENALHWIHEYHVDGLRLDATHAMLDDSPTHIVAELTDCVHASVQGRHVHIVAEDHRNLALMVAPREEFGWGLDGVWADDFHHHMRRCLAGDTDGYYKDFSGSAADLAATIQQGWFFTGQRSEHLDAPRGSDPSAVPPERFVVCLQNHDQIGNRALGERLHHQIEPAAYRAASVLFLLLPQTLLLFMGQEWAASSPFLYFTNHDIALGRLVTEGRRREFSSFAAFADEASRTRIPDPQAPETFVASQLHWAERQTDPHRSTVALYQTMLGIRRTELPAATSADARSAAALDADTIAIERACASGSRLLVVARLRGSGTLDLADHPRLPHADHWSVVLTSEDDAFGGRATRPAIDCTSGCPVIRFHGPAAVVLRGTMRHARVTTADDAATMSAVGQVAALGASVITIRHHESEVSHG